MPAWSGAVRRFESVDSTNRQARLWAREGAPHGAAVVARTQTAGRGRLGRGWESLPDAGLWISTIVRPEQPEAQWGLLPFACALAGADACQQVCGANVGIKWPNDLVLDGRKIAGLLAEREGSAVVLGIGINLTQMEADFPEPLREKAGSLLMLTGQRITPDDLEGPLLAQLCRRVSDLDFLDEYAARCVTLGHEVRVVTPGGEYIGFAQSLDAEGALMVRMADGELRRVLAGDVSVRGLMGYV